MNCLDVIKKNIEELGKLMSKKEYSFFNEHDFHHIFFNNVYKEFKAENKQDLLHPEYPTFKRLNTDENTNPHSYILGDKSAKRGHYDFVVLSEQFYQDFHPNFDKISNKTINILEGVKQPYLEVAVEFKYFISDKVRWNQIQDGINLDITKLNLAEEAEVKVLAIFIRSKLDIQKIKYNINKLNEDKKVIIFVNGEKI